MKCLNCGQEIDSDANYCIHCGISVKSASILPNKRQWKDQYSIAIIIGLCIVAGVAGFCIKEHKETIHKENAAVEFDKGDNISDDIASFHGNSPEEEFVDNAVNEPAEYNVEKQESLEDTYDVAEGGIHRYGYFIEDCTWSEAFNRAQESGGYLVHINSMEEYNYILSEIIINGYEEIQFLIGARRNPDNFDYYWADSNNNLYGESINAMGYWASSEWMIGEPSYVDGEFLEDCVDFYYNTQEERWVWNDVPDDIISVVPNYSGKIGYIVEYEESTGDEDEYLLPESNTRFILESELDGFTAEQCKIARNELYARHGRKFDDEDLQNHFNSLDWYTPLIEQDDFSESVFNVYEIANRDLIVKYEEEHGYR